MHVGNYHELRGALITSYAWNPLFSSGLLLKCTPWIKAGFWLCWSLGGSSVKGSESSLMNKNIICPLRNTSHCCWGLVTYSYRDFSLFVVLCTFRKSLHCADPLAVSEVFIGQNAVSLKKVLQPNESYLSPSMILRGVTESPALVLGKLRLAQQPGLW